MLTSSKTHLSVNPWVIHRSTEIFGADANTFDPQRWLEPTGKGLEKNLLQVSKFQSSLDVEILPF
jgi:cytochrome P450